MASVVFPTGGKIVHENDCSVTFAAKSHDQARDNPDDKGPS
jgi:hypothetical protein